LRVPCRFGPSSCWMSRYVERLDLHNHDGFERCVRRKATSFRALHLFLRGCSLRGCELVNPIIALAIAHQRWGSLLDLNHRSYFLEPPDVGCGSRLCENAKATTCDRTTCSFKIVSGDHIARAFNFEIKPKNTILVALRTLAESAYASPEAGWIMPALTARTE